MSVELRRNTLDVVHQDGDRRCGHCSPPFIRNVAACKNYHNAPGVIVSDLESVSTGEYPVIKSTMSTYIVYVGIEHSVVCISDSGAT